MLSITFYCLTSPLTVLFYIVIAITELHATSFLWRYMSTGAIISTLRIHSLCEQSCIAFLWCRVAFWARGVSNSTLLIYIKLATLCNVAHLESQRKVLNCVCAVMGGRRRGTAPACCFPLSMCKIPMKADEIKDFISVYFLNVKLNAEVRSLKNKDECNSPNNYSLACKSATNYWSINTFKCGVTNSSLGLQTMWLFAPYKVTLGGFKKFFKKK